MASLNKVLLMGNLTRKPELRYTTSGSSVCEFGIAINRTYTSNNEKKEDVCFIDINVWGRQAESCDKYLQKGSPVFIEGRLQLDTWKDKESGSPRSRLRVIAERVQFLSSPSRRDSFGDDQQYSNQPQNSNGYNNNSMQSGGYDYSQQPQSYSQPMGQPQPMQNNAIPQQPIPPAPAQQQMPSGVPTSVSVQEPQSVYAAPPAMPQVGNDKFDTSIEAEDNIPF